MLLPEGARTGGRKGRGQVSVGPRRQDKPAKASHVNSYRLIWVSNERCKRQAD